jgi:hypothetical protein
MDQKAWIVVGGVALASFSAGAFAGILYSKKVLAEGYEEILQAEVEEMREHYMRQNKVGPYSSPQEAAKTLLPSGMVLDDGDDIQATPDVSVVKSIFDRELTQPSDEELVEELGKRSVWLPYIVSDDEFMANDVDHHQASLTYFEGDETLVDEKEEPIEDIDKYVGEKNLRFGYRSNDRNIVYIRNEKLRMDFEISRSQGQYVEEVLGMPAKPTNQKRRITSSH